MVSIIAVLASLLLPALAKARAVAVRTTCMNQMYTFVTMYASRFPPGDSVTRVRLDRAAAAGPLGPKAFLMDNAVISSTGAYSHLTVPYNSHSDGAGLSIGTGINVATGDGAIKWITGNNLYNADIPNYGYGFPRGYYVVKYGAFQGYRPDGIWAGNLSALYQ